MRWKSNPAPGMAHGWNRCGGAGLPAHLHPLCFRDTL